MTGNKASGVSLTRRLGEAVGLLVGLRGHDFRAAGSLVATTFPHGPLVWRWAQFVAWACRQVLGVIPDALKETTFSRPVSGKSIWLDEANPLENHPWAGTPDSGLPAEVETVVIGAGFTGAACAYHWAQKAPPDRHMVVLEKDEPAGGASGACAGLVVMGRYYALVRRSVRAYLEGARGDLTPAQRDRVAGQFAAVYARSAYKNADMIERTISSEGFDCGYSRRGWIQAVDAADQSALEESAETGRAAGYADRQRLEPEEVFARGGMTVAHAAAFSVGAACFHPARWVWCLLSASLRRPNVSLFTRTRVQEISDAGDHYLVHTHRGVVKARHVINATESYTGLLHREYRQLVAPVQTQGAFALGGPPRMPAGIALSSKRGFFIRSIDPDGVMFGSDETHVSYMEAGRNRPSRFITKFVLGEMAGYFGFSRQEVTHEWSSTAGFTEDQYPVVGLLDGKRQYIIAGMCGSGTAVSFNAGRHVVGQILGLEQPDDYPAAYFAPSRLLDPAHHPWPAVD